MINRSSWRTDWGGDSTQMEQTAIELQKLGVEVDLFASTDSFDPGNYELLHLFNMTRPADFLHLAAHRFVLSTIYVNYSEADRHNRTGLAAVVSRMFGPDTIEYAKTLARWALKGEQPPAKAYFLKGHRQAVRTLIDAALLWLPNSDSEYRRVAGDYGIEHPYIAVPNGTKSELFLVEQPPWEDRLGVICIGRIEPRKNQLALIKALTDTDVPLHIVGHPGVNHGWYYEACQEAAGANVTFHGHMHWGDRMVELISKCRVHCLPSWFETTGLVSLEAATLGCNIVVTDKGDTVDYFRKDAWYCDPGDTNSIKQAVLEAHRSAQSTTLRDRIRNEYTWKRAAEKTLEGYLLALKIIEKR
ncbi:MAG: glycosyltransferase [Salibacteraceae bacterium]